MDNNNTMDDETSESKWQRAREYQDLIRIKVCIEHISEFHSRICNEDFRTKDECKALTDILMDLNKLQSTLEENYKTRSESYYNYDMPCMYPDSL